MTYCLAISVDAGMVFCSDSRTNAGIDQASTYSKMYRFGAENRCQFVLLAAGNLATTQGVVAKIRRDIKQDAPANLLTAASVGDAADYVGMLSVEQQEKNTGGGATFEASFILGGQVAGSPHEATLIYAQGNHITTSTDTPFLQVGESKYGKPILDRILAPATSLETAALCALVSMDSTMRSNLTVGPPIEVQVYETDSLVLSPQRYHRFAEDSEFLRELKRSWDARLKEAFAKLPPLAWSFTWDRSPDERNAAS